MPLKEIRKNIFCESLIINALSIDDFGFFPTTMSEKFRSPVGYSRSSVQAASTVKMTAAVLLSQYCTAGVLRRSARLPAVTATAEKTMSVHAVNYP